MSGIAGVVFADRQRVVPHEMADQQMRAIRRRGPDGVASRHLGNVSFSHAHRDTTGFIENNLADIDSRLIAVADMRLDNRADLARKLGLGVASGLSDTQLLLHAYRRWDENCCEHLRGDFAFAILDTVEQTLFCARDQMGVKPLFYAWHYDHVLFASELAGVVTGSAEVDDTRVAGFLLGFPADPTATAFRGAHRLSPGHSLSLRKGVLTVRNYWTMASDPGCDRPPAAIFGERLDHAVATRLRGGTALGAMLSGGLDSSSVVALAARKLPAGTLHTYSFDYPQTPRLSEREYVEAVLETCAVQQTYTGFDDLAPLQGLDQLADGRSDLLFGPGLPKMTRLFAAARQAGTRVLLDGHGGDEVVSHGFGRLSELASQGKWPALYRELRGVSGLFGDSANRMFLQYFARYGTSRRLHGLVRRLWPPPPSAIPLTAYLSPGFAARSDAFERHAEWQSRLREAHVSEASLHAWNVSTPQVGEAFEALDRAATLADVELRFPFFDLDVVRYAIGVPADEILRDGWTRSLLRRSMEGILPPRVQWRRHKIDFSSEIRHGLVRHHHDILADLSQANNPIAAYLDIGRLSAAISRLVEHPDAGDSGELFIIWRSAFLSSWLRSRSA